jgi:hypothetical protein
MGKLIVNSRIVPPAVAPCGEPLANLEKTLNGSMRALSPLASAPH